MIIFVFYHKVEHFQGRHLNNFQGHTIQLYLQFPFWTHIFCLHMHKQIIQHAARDLNMAWNLAHYSRVRLLLRESGHLTINCDQAMCGWYEDSQVEKQKNANNHALVIHSRAGKWIRCRRWRFLYKRSAFLTVQNWEEATMRLQRHRLSSSKLSACGNVPFVQVFCLGIQTLV